MKRCRKLALDKHRDHRQDFFDAYDLVKKAKKAKDDARFDVAL